MTFHMITVPCLTTLLRYIALLCGFVLLQPVRAQSISVVNGSFELPYLGTGYQYRPFDGAWTFGTYTGIQGTGSAWGAPQAPEGSQTAFIQAYGSMWQTITLPAGSYSLSFFAAQRPCCTSQAYSQNVDVLVDGVRIGRAAPLYGYGFQVYAFGFSVNAGSHTISFAGTSFVDNTAFIDSVAIVPTTTPQNAGDIVGRDLAYPGVGFAGHIGFWDGSQVIEVLNEGGNVVRKNSFDDFRSRSTPWATIRTNVANYWVKGCIEVVCHVYLPPAQGTPVITMMTRYAMARRAQQIYLIGADYTYAAYWRSAKPGGNTWSPTRGTYRCDTFVIDVFSFTIPWGNVWQELANTDLAWNKKVSSLTNTIPLIPATIYNAIGKF